MNLMSLSFFGRHKSTILVHKWTVIFLTAGVIVGTSGIFAIGEHNALGQLGLAGTTGAPVAGAPPQPDCAPSARTILWHQYLIA